MNEQKLNEIVEQAIAQNEADWPDFRKSLTGSGSLYLHVFAEKFADLIIQECVDAVKEDMYSGMTHCDFSAGADCAYAQAIHNINKKFGVEE